MYIYNYDLFSKGDREIAGFCKCLRKWLILLTPRYPVYPTLESINYMYYYNILKIYRDIIYGKLL